MNDVKCPIHSGSPVRNAPRRGSTRVTSAAMALCALLAITDGMASAAPVASSPDGTPIATQFAYDDAFATAGQYIDHFAGSNSNDYRGQKIARLANGDVVVAGIVPRSGFTTPNQLGLVRYSPSGQRRVWSSASSAYAQFGGQYIVYPNGNGGQPTGALIDVVDVATHGNSIYVMLNEQTGAATSRPLVAVFSLNGAFRGWWFNTPPSGGNTPGRAFLIQSTGANQASLIQVGDDPTPPGSSLARIWMTRFTVDADGGLVGDSSFGTAGVAYARAQSCVSVGSAAPCATYAAGIAPEGRPFLVGATRFYVATSARITFEGVGTPDFDAVALRFNSNGSRDSTFGVSPNGGDSAVARFNDGGSNNDYAVAIATSYHIEIPLAYFDDVYLLANVTRTNRPGIGVARFTDSGALDSGFGFAGKSVFGGCGAGTGNCTFTNVESVAWSMVRDGNRLAIAGWYRGYVSGTSPTVIYNYPLFVVVDAGNGSVTNFDHYYSGLGDATFYDVVANGDGSYTLGGDIRALSTGETQSYLTARLQPIDVIFRNGFD